MKNQNNIKIIKLGGSLITNKNKPFSLRKKIISDSITQIVNSNEKIILIHGGGSFGHPLAKEFNIVNGLDEHMPQQALGLAKTHYAMNKLNSYIINIFLEKNIPILPIQPSCFFIKDNHSISASFMSLIEYLLHLNIIPILYGDIILTSNHSFSIISGDVIILEICKYFKQSNYFNIQKVIFAIEKDGIFIYDKNSPDHASLLQKIKGSDLSSVKLANLNGKIDVTGGIHSKLKIISEIVKLNIPVQIVNGLNKDFIFKSLKNQDIVSTLIEPL